MTNYFPLCVNLENRKCLVVGAGSIALRKIHDLMAAGADITVISRAAHPGVLELAENGAIKLITRSYQKEDLRQDLHLVIAATNDEKLHQRIFEEAEKRHMLCNSVDDLSYCNFIMPSIVRRGDLTVGISTNGYTPFLSRALRIYLEDVIKPEWEEVVEFGKILRKRNKEGLATPEERLIFTDFWASPLGAQLHDGGEEAALTYIRDYIKKYGA